MGKSVTKTYAIAHVKILPENTTVKEFSDVIGQLTTMMLSDRAGFMPKHLPLCTTRATGSRRGDNILTVIIDVLNRVIA